MNREKRENLHKWGKAQRILDEEKIKVDLQSQDRYQFNIKGETGEYLVGVDIDTGETFCPCAFQGNACSHQIAAHLFLASIGVEKESYKS